MTIFAWGRVSHAALLVGGLLTAAPLVGEAQGLAGSYLAGRQAQYDNDFDAVGRFYGQALARDPSNALLLERTLIGYINRGDADRAATLLSKFSPRVPSNQVAGLVVVANNAREGRFQAIVDEIDAGRTMGPLLDGLFRSWAILGDGRANDALEAFDAVAQSSGSTGFALYHKGLAQASVGDFSGALETFADQDVQPLLGTRRGTFAAAAIMSQLGDHTGAAALIRRNFGRDLDLEFSQAIALLEAQKTLPFAVVTSARHGIAEVFYSVGAAIEGDSEPDYALIFPRLATYLRSDFVDATLLSAELLEIMKEYDLATEAYDDVPRGHGDYYSAELGRSEALYNAGEEETAVEVLRQLAESHGDLAIVHRKLGDVLRRLDRHIEANRAYTRALDTASRTDASLWFLHYARGITFERTDQWSDAEADFRKSLELNPGHPSVLNYLGYSLLEKGIKLDEALGLIEKAVEARPDSGFIVDSLGWGLYLTGRFEEAVVHMERAAELLPIDPVINDHLGDVLWTVGRRIEAEFHWTRALSLDPEEDDATRIRRKLDVGLDAVLEEEAKPALEVAEDESAPNTEDDG